MIFPYLTTPESPNPILFYWIVPAVQRNRINQFSLRLWVEARCKTPHICSMLNSYMDTDRAFCLFSKFISSIFVHVSWMLMDADETEQDAWNMWCQCMQTRSDEYILKMVELFEEQLCDLVRQLCDVLLPKHKNKLLLQPPSPSLLLTEMFVSELPSSGCIAQHPR